MESVTSCYRYALKRVKGWAKQLKEHTYTLWLVSKHPKLPWTARIIAVMILVYILSPIDLIPDFIPILGLLDDIILVPIFIWLLLKITPAEIYEECQTAARQEMQESGSIKLKAPKQYLGAVIVISIWLLLGWWSYTRVAAMWSSPTDTTAEATTTTTTITADTQ